MNHVQKPLRVGVWGHYHGGNLGDDVVVATLIENVRARHSDAEIFGVSIDPEDTSERHGIPAISMVNGTMYREGERVEGRASGSSLLVRVARILERTRSEWLQAVGQKMRTLSSVMQAWKLLRGADMLIVAGSTPFSSWTGAWARPYRLFKWAVLAWGTSTRLVLLNVGAERIEGFLSRFFVRRVLRVAYYRSFRDSVSADRIASIGMKGRAPVFPDLAFSLPEKARAQQRGRGRSDEASGIVGVSTVAHQDPRTHPEGDVSRYQAYLGKLASFSSRLLNDGYTLFLLQSQVEADDRVATDLRRRLAAQGVELEERVIAASTRTHRSLLNQIVQCEIVVGGRFHCHVLPFVLGKPVLGVTSHAKTFELMKYMGQAEYCLDINDMSVPDMVERFERLRERRTAVVETIKHRVRTCREVLDFQYDLLFQEDRPLNVDQNYLPTSDGHALEGVGVRLNASPDVRTVARTAV